MIWCTVGKSTHILIICNYWEYTKQTAILILKVVNKKILMRNDENVKAAGQIKKAWEVFDEKMEASEGAGNIPILRTRF